MEADKFHNSQARTGIATQAGQQMRSFPSFLARLSNQPPVVEFIAHQCHEMNRHYCAAIGDLSQPDWIAAPAWQRKSAIDGVIFALNNPNATPEDSHDSWLAQKRAEGWTYGPIKNVEEKQHPCFLPYHDLAPEQRAKDALFLQTVKMTVASLGFQHHRMMGVFVSLWS